MDLKRVAIVVDKDLTVGQVGNVGAILMGQIALLSPDIYDNAPPRDTDGVAHAGIRFSTVVLKGGPGQILNTLKTLNNSDDLTVVAFTKLGQGLHNSYEEYSKTILESSTEAVAPVAFAVVGEDAAVRSATKKFSLLQ